MKPLALSDFNLGSTLTLMGVVIVKGVYKIDIAIPLLICMIFFTLLEMVIYHLYQKRQRASADRRNDILPNKSR